MATLKNQLTGNNEDQSPIWNISCNFAFHKDMAMWLPKVKIQNMATLKNQLTRNNEGHSPIWDIYCNFVFHNDMAMRLPKVKFKIWQP